MRFIIIGYRDSYFWNDFGTSVRDLQIAEILSRDNEVIFLNRPVSIYERVLNKKRKYSSYKKYNERITFVDRTNFDIFGPLKGRIWTEHCYNGYFEEILEKYTSNYDKKVVVIDFTPLAKINYIKRKNVYYWYDLIDNFAIHNRFTDKEKALVIQKYDYVNKNANFISGVSVNAIREFTHKNKYVLSNGVYFEGNEVNNSTISLPIDNFQLGFVGFVTDKFDVEFINKLANHFSIVIWGKFFNEKIEKKLNKKIKIAGQFKYSDLPVIMKTFKVGLLPYIRNKSHDESPLKMYEYFKYGRPCISSMDFEIENKWFSNYNKLDEHGLIDVINNFIFMSESEDIRASIKSEWVFENKIKLAINKLE